MNIFKPLILTTLTIFMHFQMSFAAEVRSHEENRPTVNILTWWGYLESASPWIKKIENKCNVSISYDIYYSNTEFIERYNNNVTHYDILIYSDTISQTIVNSITLQKSNLYKVFTHYSPVFRNQYLTRKYPHNVIYFMHSLTGILYNPRLIQLNTNDSLATMFSKAQKNIAVILDDATEANMLLNVNSANSTMKPNDYQSINKINLKNFRNLSSKSTLLISNQLDNIVSKQNFAFSVTWSGNALTKMENHPSLKILFTPKLSYISTDLLAETNTLKGTNCVAKSLGSKEFTNFIQNQKYYISPYTTNVLEINNQLFKNAYNQIFKLLPKLPWIKPLSEKKLRHLNRKWELIKLELAENS